MARPKVMITDFISGGLEREQRILGDLADIFALKADLEEEMFGRIEDADMLLVYHTIRITKATIDRLKHCRLIVRCGVGYDNVDGKAARAKGITLCNVPDYGTEEVADLELSFYEAFGVSRGSLLQMFGPGVLAAGYRAHRKGHENGPRSGDIYRMPGLFLVRGDRVLWQHVYRHAGDQPDFRRIPDAARASA